jgi:aspartokinase-like uncharacterized kinase
MWVAKIGGSLGGTDALVAWLAAFVADGERAWLLVPGGGAYADLVRDSQRRWHYPDAEAHGMALQAMALYASELMAIEPRLEVCDGVDMCGAKAGRWPRLWRPALADATILSEVPADWRATSDSLALALACRLDAEGVVLLKSACPPVVSAHASALAACGYVDEWLPVLMRESAVPVYWLCRDEVSLGVPDEAQRIVAA